jgi:hypothetical protein
VSLQGKKRNAEYWNPNTAFNDSPYIELQKKLSNSLPSIVVDEETNK